MIQSSINSLLMITRVGSILVLIVAILLSFYHKNILYAQEQDIVESFGLSSKGVEYYHKGKLYEAQEALEKALKFDPRNYEAENYLNLVNTELIMRQKGRLNFYQDINNFERERDTGEDYADIDQAKCYCYDLTAEMTPGVESDNPEYYE